MSLHSAPQLCLLALPAGLLNSLAGLAGEILSTGLECLRGLAASVLPALPTLNQEGRFPCSGLSTSCSAVPKMCIYAPNETEAGSLGVISRSGSDSVGMGSPSPLPGRWARPLGAVGLGPTLQPRPCEQSTQDKRDPRCLGTQLGCWSCCGVSLAGFGP